MRKLKRLFHGIEPNSRCTGTVMLFRLNAKRMLKENIIEQRGNDYYFLGFPEE